MSDQPLEDEYRQKETGDMRDEPDSLQGEPRLRSKEIHQKAECKNCVTLLVRIDPCTLP